MTLAKPAQVSAIRPPVEKVTVGQWRQLKEIRLPGDGVASRIWTTIATRIPPEGANQCAGKTSGT